MLAYLENAKKFFAYYQSQEKQNFGVNIYLLTRLQEQGFLSADSPLEFNLTQFIRQNREKLETINILQEIKTTESIDAYQFLSQLGMNKRFINPHISINELVNNMIKADSPIDINKFLPQLAIDSHSLNANISLNNSVNKMMEIIRDNYLTIGRSYALFFETQLVCSNQDIHQRSPKSDLRNNKILKLPLYASRNPKKIKEKCDFFHEIINKKIQHIVAIGDSNELPYIQPGKKVKYSSNNISAHLNSQQLTNTNGLSHYQLDCTVNVSIGETLAHDQKILTLTHISTKDNLLELNEEALKQVYSDLSRRIKKNEGILIFCNDGRGHTGVVIATLCSLLKENKENIEKIFATDDIFFIHKNILKFVNLLRCYRRGLIKEPEQLFQFLQDAIQYKKLEYQDLMEHVDDTIGLLYDKEVEDVEDKELQEFVMIPNGIKEETEEAKKPEARGYSTLSNIAKTTMSFFSRSTTSSTVSKKEDVKTESSASSTYSSKSLLSSWWGSSATKTAPAQNNENVPYRETLSPMS